MSFDTKRRETGVCALTQSRPVRNLTIGIAVAADFLPYREAAFAYSMFGRTAEKHDIVEKFTRCNYFTHAAPVRRHAFFARFYAVARVRRRSTDPIMPP